MGASKGAGESTVGKLLFGYGEPASTAVVQGKVFTKTDGVQGMAKYIDPITRDYVVDTKTGQLKGMNLIQQQVYLALATLKGSAVIANLGSTVPNIQLAGSQVNVEIEAAVRQALKALTDAKNISIIAINVDRGNVNTRRNIQVMWMDLVTMVDDTTLIYI